MSVSILIPYYNRLKFKSLIEHNINIQDYEKIEKVIILDDSDDGTELKDLDIRFKYEIFRVNRMTIGDKRNKLIKKSASKYSIFMDSDDIYFSSFVSHSIQAIQENKNTKIVGSADMLFYFSDTKTFSNMSCLKLHLIHEATLCCETKWFKNNCKFMNSSCGEGQSLKGFEKFVSETSILKLMVCVAHQDNTVDKSSWNRGNNAELESFLKPRIETHLKLLSHITL